MANKFQTYSSSDWNVWTYVPAPGSFVLDFSQLNGPDVLGNGSGAGLQMLDCRIGGITISAGSEVSQGIFSELRPENATVSLEIIDFVKSDANKFLVGNNIVLTVRNASTIYNNTYGYNTPMFIGVIRSFTVDLQPGSNIASVTISASSYTQDLLNRQYVMTKDTTTSKSVKVSAALGSFYHYLETSAYNYATTTAETKSIGEFIEDLNLCDMNIIYDSTQAIAYVASNEIYFANKIVTSPSVTGVSAKNYNETNTTNIELDWSGAESPTGVTLTNYFNNTIVYQLGSPDQTTGAFNFSGVVDVKDLTQMESVGRKMVSMFQQFKPVSVTVKTAIDYQSLEWNEIVVFGSSVWLYPAILAYIGQTVQITNTDLGINDLMLVTGYTHEITPDDWTTTYNLWKGFTN